MKRGILLVLCLALSFFGFYSHASAKPPAAVYKHADKNDDGIVTKKEWNMEKNWEQRKQSQVNTWWESRADTNNDGRVDNSELAVWKKLEKERIDLNGDGIIDAKEKRLSWRYVKSKVNTALEKKYDANQDGWLEASEVKNMLRDRYALIQTNGKVKVDTPIEAEYDADGDGILDLKEVEDLKADLNLG